MDVYDKNLEADLYLVVNNSLTSIILLKRTIAPTFNLLLGELSRDVTVELDNGTAYGEVGELQFADVNVDPGTGTVNVRALFQNTDAVLLPGMFVRAKVPNTRLENALLVPQKAIVRQGSAITTAWVVNSDNIVELRVVEVSRAVGDDWLVRHGLASGDRVIVNGIQKVQTGIPVTPEDVTNRNAAK